MIFSKKELNHIAYECNKASYEVLSNSNISQTAARISEEGREAIAIEIIKCLCELLEQPAQIKNQDTVFIEARSYSFKDLQK